MSDDRLRALFDVLDVEATEERLSAALDAETTDPGRAEVLTQLARVAFWRDRPDEAERLLEEADSLAGETGVARARVLLERGRIVRRTGGDTVALSLLEQAYEVALAARQHFIAADAAHSCALAGDMIAWTNRGLELADRFEAARYWRGTLLLNLGDWQWEHGEPAQSLATFEAALEAREQESRNPSLTRGSPLRRRPSAARARAPPRSRSASRTGSPLGRGNRLRTAGGARVSEGARRSL